VLGEIAGGQAADEAGRPDQDEVELTVRWSAHHCTLCHGAGTDEALQASLELLADKTRIATLVGGRDPRAYGSCEFSGGTPEPLTPQLNAWRTEAIPVRLARLATGSFSVEGGQTFSLAEAAEAHRTGQAGARGEIVLLS
jgi:hypothetical protein